MDYIHFRTKTDTILRQGGIETVLDSYVPKETAFPFAIAKKRFEQNNKKVYWIIVNRFSGKSFVIRFKTRKEAEYFFNRFAEEYDISDIEFKNPKSEFRYRSISFDINNKIKQEKYMKIYFGD